MNTFENRVREQFPGLYITFTSIMIGLVLADLASVARTRLAMWPPDVTVLRGWIELITIVSAALAAWIGYTHIGIGRRRVPTMWDSFNVFGAPVYLLIMNSMLVIAPVWLWFLVVGGYLLMGWIVSYVIVHQAVAEPELGATALLFGWRGPFGVFHVCVPLAFTCALASRLGLLTPSAESLLMCGVPVSAIVFIALFFRRWHEAIRTAVPYVT
ncbi:MAG TPA: hypothetical protein VHU18_00570 [Rhizomicrobium sp.]|jgi:hypothetical protein|nr:hypothetical protein [Rhizomicrobium sp.]